MLRIPTRNRIALAAAAIATLGMAAVPMTAQAAEFVAPTGSCTSTVTGTLAGAQTVPTGQKLCLRGATVDGAITVESGASLSARGSTVNGAITLNGADSFKFCGSATVGGAISVASGVGTVVIGDNDECRGNMVDGAITVAGYTGNVTVARTTTSGALVIKSNAALSGKAPKIAANDIGGDLTCRANTPAPTNTGLPNTVHGARHGQCESMSF